MRAVALTIAVATACGSDPTAQRRQPTGAACTATSTLTYANFGQRLTTDYCTVCHSSAVTGLARAGAPSGLDFDTVEGVRTATERIDRVAAAGPDATNPDMPPGIPRPTPAERIQLGIWLACGAP